MATEKSLKADVSSVGPSSERFDYTLHVSDQHVHRKFATIMQ